jgi:MFS family permease
MIALLVCGLFPMLGLFAIGVDFPLIADAFSDNPNSRMLSQMVGGASGFAFALGSPLIGILIERYGYRQIYIVSLVGFALIGVLPLFLDNLVVIVATRCAFGVAVAGAVTAGMTGLGSLPASIRAKMFGRNAVTTSIGAIICFPLTGALASFGWRAPFLIHLLALLVLPLALALDKTAPVAARARHGGSGAAGRGLGVSPGLLAMAAFIGLVMFVAPMFAPFYVKSIGVTDPTLAALPLSIMSLGSLLVTSNYGRLHGRFGTTAIFGAILSLVGCGLLGAGFSPTLPLFAVGMFLLSCGLALFTPNLGAAISSSSPDSPSRGIGMAMSAMFLMQAIFPFVAEGLDSLAGPRGVFIFFGGAALLLAIGFTLAARRRAAG